MNVLTRELHKAASGLAGSFISHAEGNKMDSNPLPAAAESAAALVGCPKCKREMVLFGIESEGDKRDLYTFECEDCGHLEVRGVRVK